MLPNLRELVKKEGDAVSATGDEDDDANENDPRPDNEENPQSGDH